MALTDLLLPLLTGLVVGIMFAALDLPIPAPPELAGVLGIAGIYGGFKLVENLDTILSVLRGLSG